MFALFIVALATQVPAAGVGRLPAGPIHRSDAAGSLSNVKQLGLATLMYAQDHGDTLPRAATFKKDVMPYLKDPSVLTAPGGKPGSVGYFLDPRLSGGKLMKYPFVAETAEILEGVGGKQAFPYGGLTIVGYVDGHAKMVNAKAATRARTITLKETP